MAEGLGQFNINVSVSGISSEEISQHIQEEQAWLTRCLTVLPRLPFGREQIEQAIRDCCVETQISLPHFCELAAEGRIESRIEPTLLTPIPADLSLRLVLENQEYNFSLRFVVRPWSPPSLEDHFQALQGAGLRRATAQSTCYGCSNYYGQTHGGNTLVCAMHPHGPEGEECPDYE